MTCRSLAILLLCLTTCSRLDAAPSQAPTFVLNAGGHTARVWKAVFTPDQRELISVSEDKTIRFWDVATGAPLRVLRPPIGSGPEGMLYAIALSPDGNTLAVAGFGLRSRGIGAIYLISLEKGEIERVLEGHEDVVYDMAFSPDGSRLLTGSADETARIWKIEDGQCESILHGHQDNIYSVVFSPDGARCATAGNDDLAYIWDLAAPGKVKRPAGTLRGHAADVQALAWSRDGTIATGSKDAEVRLWNSSGEHFKTIRGTLPIGLAMNSVLFTPDSRKLIFTQSLCSGVHDLKGGATVRVAVDDGDLLSSTISPDGALVATAARDGHILLWRVADGEILHRLAAKGTPKRSAAWRADGAAIAWGEFLKKANDPRPDHLEQVFDLAQMELRVRPPADSEEWLRSSLRLGKSSIEKDAGILVTRLDGQFAAGIPRSADYTFTLLQDGDKVLAAVPYRSDIELYDAVAGPLVRRLEGHAGTVCKLRPSPPSVGAGRYLLSASVDRTLRIWRPDRSEPLLSLFFTEYEWIAWTPEGYYACSPGGEHLMGWHIDRGRDKLGVFASAEQFRKKHHRPAAIQALLGAGSIERALAITSGEQKSKISENLPPSVVILKSAKSPSQSEVEISAVAVEVGGQPIRSIQLLVDGASFGKVDIRQRTPQVGRKWSVPLSPGRHQIQALASSDVSQGASQILDVEYKPQTARTPKLYVLAIGVSEYQDEGLMLKYADRDAAQIVQAFETNVRGLYTLESRVIVNDKATDAGIRRGFSWFNEKMAANDGVGVVFFAGHGDVFKGVNRETFYLLPHNADPDDLIGSGVSASYFMNVLRETPSTKILMLDACHAGAVGARNNFKRTTDNLVQDLASADVGVVTMCATTRRGSARESDALKHGYFTQAVVEGLSGARPSESKVEPSDADKNGKVYWDELDQYVAQRVRELTNNRQIPVSAHPAIPPIPLTKIR